ncbi:Polycystic Kidney Disease And Receptor For Egg Jelly-Related Protein [Manis pentadactyla]|nr:Polycystic Kidney Disease And Receptor For Egg Jelly-Related Protein [Manis pentadactyla]
MMCTMGKQWPKGEEMPFVEMVTFAFPLPAERLCPARRSPKSFGKFRLQRGGRGGSSSSGPSSVVSVRGRCALGTGRRWLAPWLRLLSRRRLLLPVARAAGRSGVLVTK